ncbi:hypothetical protein Hanom_Chr06g00498741 [Helianthus anomalus]
MLLWTGIQEMTLQLWALQGDQWVSMFSAPPIPPMPLATWLTITHYMTNGKWFVMNGPHKLHEFSVDDNPLWCFYPVSWFRGHIGTIYIKTVISPYI